MKYGHAANESGYDSPGGIIQPTINSTGDFKTVTKSSIINFPNSSNQAYYSVSNSEFLRSLGLKGQVDRKIKVLPKE
ncbi:MAG TPA: hypothetical protein VNS50_06930, partial [Ginsengibacter sp.]|nr:hypothetical protein [Ginsengibacter sp.]